MKNSAPGALHADTVFASGRMMCEWCVGPKSHVASGAATQEEAYASTSRAVVRDESILLFYPRLSGFRSRFLQDWIFTWAIKQLLFSFFSVSRLVAWSTEGRAP
jgi:hypothetical protein